MLCSKSFLLLPYKSYQPVETFKVVVSEYVGGYQLPKTIPISLISAFHTDTYILKSKRKKIFKIQFKISYVPFSEK